MLYKFQVKNISALTTSVLFVFASCQTWAADEVQIENIPAADEIVQQCEIKPAGDDQRSKLTIKLTDRSGNEKVNVYARLWKDNKGKEEIADKMILFTLYPPDAKDTAFMRWSYTPDSGKNAEQWIYLPQLKKIRRVSVRDMGDSFLGSDLTYGDISPRRLSDDVHKFLRIETDNQGKQYYVVDSTPKESTSIYSHKITKYLKADNMADCAKVAVDYYDRNGNFLKRQKITWQIVDKAWVWDNVYVENVQTFHSSYFEMRDVKINSGIPDDIYTERRLSRGL